MSSLKFTKPAQWRGIETHFREANGERFAFAFTRPLSNTVRGPVLEVVDVELIPDDDVHFDRTGWFLSEDALDRVHNRAAKAGLGLAEFHNHGRGHAVFSRTDENGLAPMAAYVLDLLRDRPYVAGVWAAGQLHAEWWRYTGHGQNEIERHPFDTVVVFGDKLFVPNSTVRLDARLDRQVSLLTETGQAALRSMRVAVVGAGGTGSHMLTQLAYLGVRDIVILDADVLEESNLNRVVTAGRRDVGEFKADLAERRIKDVDPGATVELFKALTVDQEHRELLDVDLIIGCVDHDGPRHRLMQLALQSRTPYLDVATGADASAAPVLVGGRVILSLPGDPCLTCLGELDTREVGRWGKSTEQQNLDRDHGYGTTEANPSVVFLNSLVVSAAIGELVAWVSGARPPAKFLDVDIFGDEDNPGVRIAPRRVPASDEDCFECGAAQEM